MGHLVKNSEVPESRRVSSYDLDIAEAAKMDKDHSWQVDIPSGANAPKPGSVAQAISQRIKQNTKNGTLKIPLHVQITKGQIWIRHGAPRARTVKSKSR